MCLQYQTTYYHVKVFVLTFWFKVARKYRKMKGFRALHQGKMPKCEFNPKNYTVSILVSVCNFLK